MTPELIIGGLVAIQKISAAIADYHANGAVSDEQLATLRAANQVAADELVAKLEAIADKG